MNGAESERRPCDREPDRELRCGAQQTDSLCPAQTAREDAVAGGSSVTGGPQSSTQCATPTGNRVGSRRARQGLLRAGRRVLPVLPVACSPAHEPLPRDLQDGFLLMQKKEYQVLYGPNGRVARLLRDANGDGLADVVVVFDADGRPEHGEIDSDGDGVVDRTESVSGLDLEYDRPMNGRDEPRLMPLLRADSLRSARRACPCAVLASDQREAQARSLPPGAPRRHAPTLDFTAGLDTNVYLTETNPVDDTSVILRGALDAYCPVGSRFRLVGSGWLEYNYFKSQTSERSTDPGGQGHLEFDLWRLTPFVGGGTFRTHQFYTTDIDERIERNEEWLYAGSRLRFTSQLSIGLGVERRKYRWGESAVSGSQIADELNRDSTTYRGEARLRHSALTDLVASAERLEDTFLVAPPSLATTISHRYLVGFEFSERAFITGRFLAGLRDIPDETAGSAAAYRGPAVQATLSMPFLQRLRLTAGYDRDVDYSAERADPALRNTYTYDRLQGALEIEGPLKLVRASAGATKTPTTFARFRPRTARLTGATRCSP